MAYAGYLIKLGGAGGTVLPMDYFQAESYTSEKRRTEISNRQDVTGKTHRTVAEHQTVRIELETRAIRSTNLAPLIDLISRKMTDKKRRDITIQYYDTELDTYKTATCYMPDLKMTIREMEQDSILFEPIRFSFIEY